MNCMIMLIKQKLLLCLFVFGTVLKICSPFDSYSGENGLDDHLDECEPPVPQTNVCVPPLLGGWQWLLSVRHDDFGWKENTHRAVIALALNDWNNIFSTADILQMELQLEVELTKAMLGNSSLLPNDLALYIHALMATQRNPRDFHGIDLVSDLQRIVDSSKGNVHPFLLLALCNANAMKQYHVELAGYALQRYRHSRQNTEYEAMALQAYACAESLPVNLHVNQSLIRGTQKKLAELQREDGSFGNVYTTSLVVQALATSESKWDRERALRWLELHSTSDVNMVSTYLIQLALHAEQVPFIKSLHPNLIIESLPVITNPGFYYVQYTIRGDRNAYFTITLKVPSKTNFFDIMKLSAEHDTKFNFSHYLDKEGRPSVYSISDLPNNAEEGIYWRLCLQADVNHNRHISSMTTIRTSPAMLIPEQDQHVIYWYKNTDCEEH